MLLHIAIGAILMGSIWFLVDFAKKHELSLAWWQWLLTVAGLAYAVFVLEVIVGFFGEGEPQAAMVMGLVTALPAVIYFVLLFRFVFTKPKTTN